MNIEEWSSQTKKDEVGVIAIDFDNVIHNNGKGFYDGTCYGKPIDGAIADVLVGKAADQIVENALAQRAG